MDLSKISIGKYLCTKMPDGTFKFKSDSGKEFKLQTGHFVQNKIYQVHQDPAHGLTIQLVTNK